MAAAAEHADALRAGDALVAVSVAVIDWVPAVLSVAVNVHARVAGGEGVVGRQDGLGVAAGEVDRAGVAGGELPLASNAVTVTLWATPAVVGLGKPVTVKVLAPAGLTVMPDWVPVISSSS